jgi:hypothetical protein
MEKLSLEKAQLEAQELEKKVQSGEAHNYTEAEQILDTEHYQGLIWERPSDEQIARFNNLDVNTTADTPINSPQSLRNEELKKLISTTDSTRLIDLGSATTVFRRSDNQLKLEEAGVREYIGVDLGIKSSEFHPRDSNAFDVVEKRKSDPAYQEPAPENRVQLKSIHGEIVTTLHSFPDNYGNVWMTGLEDGNVIPYYDEWGFALFAELKRVVPENGFIFTDGGFADQVLEKCAPEFKKVRHILHRIHCLIEYKYDPDFRDKKFTDEEIRQSISELLTKIKPYECKKDDPLYLGKTMSKYMIDVPNIGFRIHFSRFRNNWYEPIVLINTRKTREGEEHQSISNEANEINKESSETKPEYTEADFKRQIEETRQMRNDSYNEYLDMNGAEWVDNFKKKNSERPDIAFAKGIIERGFKLVPGYMTLESQGTTGITFKHFNDVLNNPNDFSPEAVRQAQRFEQLRADVEKIFPTIPDSDGVLGILKEDFKDGFSLQNKGLDVLIKLYVALRNLGYSHYEISHPGELIGE